MTEHDIDKEAPKPLWVSIMTVVAGVAILALVATVIHYRDLYADTLDRLRKTEFRQKALEEDSSNFRFVQKDSSIYTLQLIPTLTHSEKSALEAKGLWRPYDDLAADLVNNWDTVCSEHGTFAGGDSLTREGVCVLSEDRVLAVFDDGDTHGTVLLTYQVSDTGVVSWRLLEAVLD
jgi:hypothetical protein